MTTRERIKTFLSERTTLTLATVGSTGEPNAAAVFFVHDAKLDLYFLAAKTTQHGKDMLEHPHIAVTVQADNQAIATIAGVQMRGRAHPVTALQLPRAAALYARKFAFTADLLDLTRQDAVSAALSASTFWKFEPQWARWIDNSCGFAHHEEIDFSGDVAERQSQATQSHLLAEKITAHAKPPIDICHRRTGQHK